MEIYSIAPITEEQLCQITHCIHDWLSQLDKRLAHEKTYAILHDALKKDRAWEQGVYCVELGPMGQWLFKLRGHEQPTPAYTRWWYWMCRAPFWQSFQIREALHPLWCPVEAKHCLLEFICPVQGAMQKEHYYALLQMAMNKAKTLNFQYLDCHLSKQDLYGASICRRLGFALTSFQPGKWYKMSKKL